MQFTHPPWAYTLEGCNMTAWRYMKLYDKVVNSNYSLVNNLEVTQAYREQGELSWDKPNDGLEIYAIIRKGN